MSEFLKFEDFEARMNRKRLAQLCDNDAPKPEDWDFQILWQNVRFAEAELRQWLSGSFDVNLILQGHTERDDPRDMRIVNTLVSMTLYKLEIRQGREGGPLKKEYDNALKWLKDVASFKLPIDDLPLKPKPAEKEHPEQEQHLLKGGYGKLRSNRESDL
jgi:phage gp36-like protein